VFRAGVLALALAACRSEPRTLGNPASAMPEHWIGPKVEVRGPTAAKATLIRFWTDGCPHCRVSLPAIAALREEFHERGLETIAIYHTRQPRPPDPAEVEAIARGLGYAGPLAADLDWRTLSAAGLGDRTRKMTSATFLLDHDGKVRFTHPGPEIHPSSDPDHLTCQGAFESLRSCVQELLGEPNAKQADLGTP